jgi:putative lipoic acid-binding regulatory protein
VKHRRSTQRCRCMLRAFPTDNKKRIGSFGKNPKKGFLFHLVFTDVMCVGILSCVCVVHDLGLRSGLMASTARRIACQLVLWLATYSAQADAYLVARLPPSHFSGHLQPERAAMRSTIHMQQMPNLDGSGAFKDIQEYPCDLDIKVIGNNEGPFVADILTLCAEITKQKEDDISVRWRDNGKYRAITLNLHFLNCDQVRMRAHAQLKDRRVMPCTTHGPNP